MALENITDMINPLNSEFWSNLPPEILTPFSRLITILQIAGIIFIAYLLFLIISWIFNIKKYRKISKIYKKVEIIDKKLDLLLSKKKLGGLEEKKEKPEKKGFRLFRKRKKIK